MGKVRSSATMSLDGYIAFDNNMPGPLFDWYEAGEIEVTTATPELTFHLTQQSAEYWHQAIESSGALVVGRTLFDVTDGWGGRHPIDLPVVVVTHNVPTEWVKQHHDAPFTFVTEGVSAAVAKAKEIAGDKDVDVAAGTMATQALELGLLDEVTVDIAPVVLGQGRPYFGPLGIDPVLLDDPTTVIERCTWSTRCVADQRHGRAARTKPRSRGRGRASRRTRPSRTSASPPRCPRAPGCRATSEPPASSAPRRRRRVGRREATAAPPAWRSR